MRSERAAIAGEVWQESDNVLLLCIKPGVSWLGFGDRHPVAWDAPNIAYPLRRMLDPEGNLVPEYLAAHDAAVRESVAVAIEASRNEREAPSVWITLDNAAKIARTTKAVK